MTHLGEATTAQRIRELRKRHGWTQQELADAMNRFGAQADRALVAKIEVGKRGLSLNEAFLFALALDVAPVHLFVPTDSAEPLNLGTNFSFSPAEARAWVRGQKHMFVQDARTYYSEVPEAEIPEELRSPAGQLDDEEES